MTRISRCVTIRYVVVWCGNRPLPNPGGGGGRPCEDEPGEAPLAAGWGIPRVPRPRPTPTTTQPTKHHRSRQCSALSTQTTNPSAPDYSNSFSYMIVCIHYEKNLLIWPEILPNWTLNKYLTFYLINILIIIKINKYTATLHLNKPIL